MLVVGIVLFCAVGGRAGENWPQFRGPGSRGIAASETITPPDHWSATENVLWKADVAGRGWSSPIVWGDKIFLTTAVYEVEPEPAKKGLYFGGERLTPPENKHQWKVVCLDLATGAIQWQQVAHEGVPNSSVHIKNSYASETPCTDGERVYAYFGNVGVFCYDLSGQEIWRQKWPARRTQLGWGTGASPIVFRNRLFIVNDNEEESYLACLNAHTGEELWRVSRDEQSNWSTPLIWQNDQRTELITCGARKVRSYDLDGNLLYEFGGMSKITVCTPFADEGLLFVSSGYVMDRNRPIFAVRPGASGDISLDAESSSNDFIAWSQKTAAPYNTSTVLYKGLLYVVLDRGLMSCYDARTGEMQYEKKRLPDGRAFTSSPWAYDDKIFCVNEDGKTFVIRAGREFELLHTNDLADDDMCLATPAIVGNKLLLRTAKSVYCLQKGVGAGK